MKLLSKISTPEFARWANTAKPGDKIEYCMGENTFATLNDPAQRWLYGKLFDTVRLAAERGNIALFQRSDYGTTTYIAMKVLPGFHKKVKEIADGTR